MKRNNSSPAHRHRDITASRLRSALTNGSRLVLGDIDERSPWCRRLRDLLASYATDLGGDDGLSEGQRAIVRRAAMLTLQLEMLESRFVENEGAATVKQLAEYQRASSSLRRLIESLGLHTGRRQRDVTPTIEEIAREAAA